MYPAACGNKSPEYKGIIFMVHGFGDYAERVAHVGKRFSDAGYDFFI